MNIPRNFTIIRRTEDMVEFQSQYHYWRATRIPNTELFILAHKYSYSYVYHKQNLPPSTLNRIFKYVNAHDNYFSQLPSNLSLSTITDD